jgi:anoctamin-10
MYFSFLSAYSYSLVFPAGLGALTYAFGTPYSSVYSIGVVLWAITFTEWWRIHERILSVRWRTRGSFRVERNRAQFDEAVPRWRRDLRATAGVPVILLFAAILGALMTAIFVFEAFITQLYTGPGHQHVVSYLLPDSCSALTDSQGLAPTILFMALVPRLMGLYQKAAIKLTHWEDHAHQSTHEASLTLKTFSLSAVVAYLGLILSAFVYVPFGGDVMARVQTFLFHHTEHPVAAGTHQAAKGYATIAATVLNTTAMNATGPASDGHKPLNRGLWEADALNARARLNPARLQDQMFAFMVTNQAINIFLEVGLPFVLRGFGKLQGKAAKAKNKRVAFEDEKADAASPEAKQERELLERIRAEVALPEYALYLDYAEMATQFGYVALWSTIWPLAPVMSWLNNILELRSDAYKITVHQRRPVPVRSDTIGPWLEALQTLAWVAALTNGALVFLFRPEAPDVPRSTTLNPEHEYAAHALGRAPQTTRELLAGAFALALLASHGALFARALIRHVLERALWSGHEEAVNADRADKEARENYLQSLGVNADAAKSQAIVAPTPADGSFWAADEGFDEIRRNLKDA